MIQTINRYDFADAFINIRPENFSRDGLNILFDYLEEYEDSIGQQIELDVIALCCDYAEDAFESIASEYRIDITNMTRQNGLEAVLEYLSDNTIVCGVTKRGSIVYCSAF